MSENENVTLDRSKVIVRPGILGIVVNCMLAGVKAFFGLLSNSVAIILDAVNNFSDALSSVITIVGTKLAGRAPDKKHPLGYGRIEYLTAMIIAAIVIYAGLTSMVESVKKTFNPGEVDYSTVTLAMIAVAVVVKLVLGRFVKKTGERVMSDALIASGADALFDAVLSFSVLVSAVLFVAFKINIEAYVGIFIAAFIIKAGIEMLMSTLDDILGKRAPKEYTDGVKRTICEDEAVSNAYDLILHSYGPGKFLGSVHVEVPDNLKAADIDQMERRIAANVYARHGIIMTGIGIYTTAGAKNTKAAKLQSEVMRTVASFEGVLQVHGYFCDQKKKHINLDVVIDYDIRERDELIAEITEKLVKDFPEYTFDVVQDIDI